LKPAFGSNQLLLNISALDFKWKNSCSLARLPNIFKTLLNCEKLVGRFAGPYLHRAADPIVTGQKPGREDCQQSDMHSIGSKPVPDIPLGENSDPIVLFARSRPKAHLPPGRANPFCQRLRRSPLIGLGIE